MVDARLNLDHRRQRLDLHVDQRQRLFRDESRRRGHHSHRLANETHPIRSDHGAVAQAIAVIRIDVFEIVAGQDREDARLRQVQPDALPLVTVRGDRVETQVLVLGALVDGRRTPETYLTGYDKDAPPPPPPPRRLVRPLAAGVLLALAIAFALGRRSARPR